MTSIKIPACIVFLTLACSCLVYAQLPAPGGTIDPLVPANTRATTLPPTTVSPPSYVPQSNPSIETLSYSSSLQDSIEEADRANLLNQERRRYQLMQQMIQSQQFQRPPNLTASEFAEIERKIPAPVEPPPHRFIREIPPENLEAVDMRSNQVFVRRRSRDNSPSALAEVNFSYPENEIGSPIQPEANPVQPTDWSRQSPLEVVRRALSPIPSPPSRNSVQAGSDPFGLLKRALSPIPSAPPQSSGNGVDQMLPSFQSEQGSNSLPGPFAMIRRALSPIPSAPNSSEGGDQILPSFEPAAIPSSSAVQTLPGPLALIRRALSPIPRSGVDVEQIEPSFGTSGVSAVTSVQAAPQGMVRRALSPVPSQSDSSPFDFVRRALSPVPNLPQEVDGITLPVQTAEPLRPLVPSEPIVGSAPIPPTPVASISSPVVADESRFISDRSSPFAPSFGVRRSSPLPPSISTPNSPLPPMVTPRRVTPVSVTGNSDEPAVTAPATTPTDPDSGLAQQADALGISPALLESGAVKIENEGGGLFSRSRSKRTEN